MDTKQNTREQKLKLIFASHPKEDAVFITSDDKAFFTPETAGAHAQRLADKTVQPYQRKTVQADEKLAEAILRQAQNGLSVNGNQLNGGGTGDKLKELRAEYKELFGKAPGVQWDAEKLAEMIAAKKVETPSVPLKGEEAANASEAEAGKETPETGGEGTTPGDGSVN